MGTTHIIVEKSNGFSSMASVLGENLISSYQQKRFVTKVSSLILCDNNSLDFCSVIFSGSGIISRDELSAFYSSVLGFDTIRVGEILDVAYQAMTSNGDHSLSYHVYRLCFANYLLARYPNGSGQFLLGFTPSPMPSALFPVDYSALNTQPEDLEQYAPDHKSNRRSIIV